MKRYEIQHILTPFLMGQRRDDFKRLIKLTELDFSVVDIPKFTETKIEENNIKIEKMGEIYLKLSKIVKQIVEKGKIPLSIAGDCVSALGVLAGLQKAKKQLDYIIWLDAHGDFHTWETTESNYIGGMPLAMLVGRGDQRIVEKVGLIPYPEQIILSDARSLQDSERKALEESKIIKCKIGEILGILKNIPENKTIYLHFDTDVLYEPERMSALKYHEEGGPNLEEMDALFKELAKRKIIAISVSGWFAELDIENKTALAVMKLLANFTE